MGEKGSSYRVFYLENLNEKAYFKYPSVDRRIILKYNFKKGERTWIEFFWLTVGTSGRLLYVVVRLSVP
jgi:hypothetical protein